MNSTFIGYVNKILKPVKANHLKIRSKAYFEKFFYWPAVG